MKKPKQAFWLLGAVMALALVSGSTALALPPRAAAHAQDATTTDVASGSTGQDHLAAAQLKVCQNREKAITNIMSRIADRGQKQLTLFGTIASRTETFYTNKGKTLSTYETLVADVNAKAAAAQAVVSSITTTATGFTCGGNDPRGVVSSFKSSLKTEISALQAYRTSVKNLIVGVKSVQSTSSTDTSSASNTTNTTEAAGGNQ